MRYVTGVAQLSGFVRFDSNFQTSRDSQRKSNTTCNPASLVKRIGATLRRWISCFLGASFKKHLFRSTFGRAQCVPPPGATSLRKRLNSINASAFPLTTRANWFANSSGDRQAHSRRGPLIRRSSKSSNYDTTQLHKAHHHRHLLKLKPYRRIFFSPSAHLPAFRADPPSSKPLTQPDFAHAGYGDFNRKGCFGRASAGLSLNDVKIVNTALCKSNSSNSGFSMGRPGCAWRGLGRRIPDASILGTLAQRKKPVSRSFNPRQPRQLRKISAVRKRIY